MRILHVVPGLDDPANGIAVAAKLIAEGQAKSRHEVEVVDTRDFVQANDWPSGRFAEVWVHSMWLPMTIRACRKVLGKARRPEGPDCSLSRPKLVRMTHANLDPVRLGYHGWRKRLVAPIERWLFRHTDRVVVTCEAEKGWCQAWGLGNEFEVVDPKRFFRLDAPKPKAESERRNLQVLYLGRRHPLKGVEFLEKAVEEVNTTFEHSEHSEHSNIRTIDLRIVSDHFGEELEQDWAWCDVLCLPTLSENFGLVVAEALERGKRVVTTDGAPAWEPPDAVQAKPEAEQWRDRLVYLRGYREGSPEARVDMLKRALSRCVEGSTG